MLLDGLLVGPDSGSFFTRDVLNDLVLDRGENTFASVLVLCPADIGSDPDKECSFLWS